MSLFRKENEDIKDDDDGAVIVSHVDDTETEHEDASPSPDQHSSPYSRPSLRIGHRLFTTLRRGGGGGGVGRDGQPVRYVVGFRAARNQKRAIHPVVHRRVSVWCCALSPTHHPQDGPYSSTRVRDDATDQTNVQSLSSSVASPFLDWPFGMVGKLFFIRANDRKPASCTASTIERRVIVTAAHCVHDGKNGFHTNFEFIPGYRSFTSLHPLSFSHP